MKRETGRCGCRTTTHAECQIGFLSLTGAPGLRDSTSQRHANAMLTRQSAAAISPGTSCPKWVANDPMTGPSMTPSALAAESQPSALARSDALMVSPTYACTTPVVPPPAPWMSRERKRSQSVPENAKTM